MHPFTFTIKKRLIAVMAAITVLLPVFATAQEFTVRPFLWDVTVAPRDIVSQDITISNQSGRLLRLYATVNEITVDSEGEIREFVPPTETDRTTNVTSWLEITRGRITLEPGATTTIPLGLKIHPSAEPGEYHAYIGFYDTNKRFEAEAAALRGDTIGFPVKVTLSEIRTSDLYVSALSVPRFVFSPERTSVSIEFTNNGETPESPSGELIFYSNRGQEVAALDVEASDLMVGSGETVDLEQTVSLPSDIGRYTVSFSGQYGETNKKPLIANSSFYVMPIWFLVILVITFLLLVVLLVFLLRRAHHEHRPEGSEEEVELPLRIRSGYSSKTTDHDITIAKKD